VYVFVFSAVRASDRAPAWDDKPAVEDPSVRIMYCRDKIYCGTTEFSFEELRAARWFLKKKRADEEMANLNKLKEALRTEMRFGGYNWLYV